MYQIKLSLDLFMAQSDNFVKLGVQPESKMRVGFPTHFFPLYQLYWKKETIALATT